MQTNQDQILLVLSELSKKREGPVSAVDIAEELKCPKATVTTLLGKLKTKGMVEGGGTEWMPSEAGTTKVESGSIIVPTTHDVGVDELSKFNYYGQICAQQPDEITVAAEMFKEGDMQSMEHFDSVMAQAHVPMQPRDKWRNLYLTYLRAGTPVEQRDKLYPLPPPPPDAEKPAAATVIGKEVKGEESRDWNVDGVDIHRSPIEGMGDFTFKEALQSVAAKRGIASPATGEQSGSVLDVVKSIKELSPVPAQPQTAEELLILIQKVIDLRGKDDGVGEPPSHLYTDAEGTTRKLEPGEHVVIKPAPAAPRPNFYLDPATNEWKEMPADGRPLSITINQGGGDGQSQVPFPVFGNDGQPVYDKDGKPVVANLEPMMKWIGFQGEQKRAGEMHDAKVGAFKAVRENLGDIVSAFKIAAQEAKGGGGTGDAAKGAPQGQTYQCGECNAQFMVPDGPFAAIECPKCKHKYTREEVLA